MAKSNPKDQKAIEKLGSSIRKIRKDKKISMVELAGLCDVDYTTISNIERGLVNTTISMISIIARALNVKPSQLLE